MTGLTQGAMVALVALGYTMVFGVVKLLNFAHGDLYMTGAFAGLASFSVLAGVLGPGWLGVAASVVAAMIAVGTLGVIIERIAYEPMLKSPRLSILITALAVSLVLQNSMLTLTAGQFLPFSPKLGFAGINLGPVFINFKQIALAAVASLLMLGLELFVSRTQYGRAMRAVSVDKDMAELLGIDVKRIVLVTFFLGSALAGAAGTMAGSYYGSINYFMGFLIGLKAFTAAVIGGIGSIPGAMLGGLVLGLLESFGTTLPGIGSEWKDVFSFSVLILVLVFKPTGFLGKSEQERM